MQYIALIYTQESDSAPEPAMMQAYNKFNQEMGAKGYLKNGHALQPSSQSTCVSVRKGKTQLRDGPFVETKEQLAGYYIVECANLDEAVEIAAKIPDAANGTIEVRPVLTM